MVFLKLSSELGTRAALTNFGIKPIMNGEIATGSIRFPEYWSSALQCYSETTYTLTLYWFHIIKLRYLDYAAWMVFIMLRKLVPNH